MATETDRPDGTSDEADALGGNSPESVLEADLDSRTCTAIHVDTSAHTASPVRLKLLGGRSNGSSSGSSSSSALQQAHPRSESHTVTEGLQGTRDPSFETQQATATPTHTPTHTHSDPPRRPERRGTVSRPRKDSLPANARPPATVTQTTQGHSQSPSHSDRQLASPQAVSPSAEAQMTSSLGTTGPSADHEDVNQESLATLLPSRPSEKLQRPSTSRTSSNRSASGGQSSSTMSRTSSISRRGRGSSSASSPSPLTLSGGAGEAVHLRSAPSSVSPYPGESSTSMNSSRDDQSPFGLNLREGAIQLDTLRRSSNRSRSTKHRDAQGNTSGEPEARVTSQSDTRRTEATSSESEPSGPVSFRLGTPCWSRIKLDGRSRDVLNKAIRAHTSTLVEVFHTVPTYGVHRRAQHTTTVKESYLYIFGGCDSRACFRDLYKLDLTTMHMTRPRVKDGALKGEPSQAPPNLRAHSTTYIPPFATSEPPQPIPAQHLLKQSMLSGATRGMAEAQSSETNSFLPTSAPSSSLPAPAVGHPPLMNTSPSTDGHLLVFGGGDGPSYFDTLYLLNLRTYTWTKPPFSGPTPAARRAHTALWYDNRKRGSEEKKWLVIFGGGNGSKALNDLCILDCRSWKELTWLDVKTKGQQPRLRGYHTMNLIGDKAVVYGGSDGVECFSDVFILELETLTWTAIPIFAPSLHCPRLSHTATLITPRHLLILGGHDGTEYKNSLIVFDLDAHTFIEYAHASSDKHGGPMKRGYHTANLWSTSGISAGVLPCHLPMHLNAQDSHGTARILLLGGFDGKHHFDDCWQLDFGTWLNSLKLGLTKL